MALKPNPTHPHFCFFATDIPNLPQHTFFAILTPNKRYPFLDRSANSLGIGSGVTKKLLFDTIDRNKSIQRCDNDYREHKNQDEFYCEFHRLRLPIEIVFSPTQHAGSFC